MLPPTTQLQVLHEIERGFRAAHTAAVGIVQAHPGNVQGLQAWYSSELTALLGVARRQQGPPGQQRQDALAAAPIKVPGGGAYDEPTDLWLALLKAQRVAAQVAGTATTPPRSAGPGHDASSQQHTAAAAEASGTADSARLVRTQSQAAKPLAKMTEAEAAAAAAAAEAAEAEAAAAAERAAAEAAAREAAAAAVPRSLDGVELCFEAPLPEQDVRGVLRMLQVGIRWPCLHCTSTVRNTVDVDQPTISPPSVWLPAWSPFQQSRLQISGSSVCRATPRRSV